HIPQLSLKSRAPNGAKGFPASHSVRELPPAILPPTSMARGDAKTCQSLWSVLCYGVSLLSDRGNSAPPTGPEPMNRLPGRRIVIRSTSGLPARVPDGLTGQGHRGLA